MDSTKQNEELWRHLRTGKQHDRTISDQSMIHSHAHENIKILSGFINNNVSITLGAKAQEY